MVIDTSALLAILFGESERDAFIIAIDSDPIRLISIASVLEAAVVLQRRSTVDGANELDALIAAFPIEPIAIDLEQLRWARHGFQAYGRGRHPAGLNFGDCFSYALAKATGEPLLFKGGDFTLTDIAAVLP